MFLNSDEDEYAAFGLSGDPSSTAMIGADVVVVGYDSQQGPTAMDYTITSYAQVSVQGPQPGGVGTQN